MTESDLTGFLRPAEKKTLQSMYEKWLEEITVEPLIVKMYKCGLVSNYDRQRIDAERMPIAKAQIIFHDVLMRSPYEDLSRIRRLLVETRMNGNVTLARMFPDRGEPINFTPPPYQSHAEDTVSQQCTDSKPEHPDLFDIGIAPSEPMDCDEPKSAGIRSKKSKKSEKHDYERIHTYYQVRPGNQDSPTGKGLCVVIRNFTLDLGGYLEDARLIRNFFENYLKYEVMEGACNEYRLLNLSYSQFDNALDKIAKKLETGHYDRFFLFVLSHGDDKGIKTNANGIGDHQDEEDDKFSVDKILGKFDHLNLPNMKCFPKCFFIQACRGTEAAKAAANPSSTARPQKPIPHPDRSITRAVGADILVCFPSQMGYLSWVPNSGSWFVQETVAVLRKYYETEHVLDMMVEVAEKISQRTGLGEVKAKGEKDDEYTSVPESVYQMPHAVCTLTKKFFLHLPPK